MPCIVVLIILAFPRVALFLMFLFSNYLERAYHGLLIPLLGFFLLPLTTIAYAWIINGRYALEGPPLVLLILAALVDLGILGGTGWGRRRQS